ncbi:hypothetical protein [Leisingera sp. ANG-DT]|uniref:hypothetical protein n=1 Tax=Leisingera sp. ANG-DT TaxID=1577897 RepID=UPI00057CA305|nr:hypothetical protein [Leisingera sp. ANG-DT]KIC15633.1 hypothetical protein RA21_15470 [Leisingera sp. ANG-DT]
MLAAILMATAGVAAAAAVIDSINDEDDAPVPPDEPELRSEPEPEPEPEFEETVRGTAGDDVLEIFSGQTGFGLDGNDTLGQRFEDNLTLHGGDGDDYLYFGNKGIATGGDGNDTIDAGSFIEVSGGQGDDEISAGREAEVDGGSGNDTISAGLQGTVTGGAGNDLIDSGRESAVSGGTGDDTLSGSSGSTLEGGAGNDEIHLRPWSGERAYGSGGDGADNLTGNGHVDLHGGECNDTLTYTHAFDRSEAPGILTGGAGADVFNVGTTHTGATLTDAEKTTTIIRDFDPEEDVLVLYTGEFEGQDFGSIVEFETRPDGDSTEVVVRFTGSHAASDAYVKTAVIRVEGVSDLSADQILLIDSGGPELDPVFGDGTGETYAGGSSSSYSTFGGDDTVEAGGIHDVARLGDGNDVLTATSHSLSVNAGNGDDAIVWTPAGSSDSSSIIDLGAGDDTLTASGDNLEVRTGLGTDVVDISRDAGADIEVQSQGGNQLSVGMGHDVHMAGDGDRMTVNIYPEHLDRDSGLLTLASSSVTDFTVTLNLPSEIEGPLEITREFDGRYEQQEVYRYTFAAEDGTELLVMDIPEGNAFSADDVIVNRDVVFT